MFYHGITDRQLQMKYMAARRLSITNNCVEQVAVFNFSGCGLKANTWQTLGETIKGNEAIKKTNEKL